LPKLKDVDPLLDFLRGRTPGTDRHTAQAFVFDRQARLVYRTEDMPQPEELVKLMQRVAVRSELRSP
jgi:protein SCO1/2